MAIHVEKSRVCDDSQVTELESCTWNVAIEAFCFVLPQVTAAGYGNILKAFALDCLK